MMDSHDTNQPLEGGKLEEEKKLAELPEVDNPISAEGPAMEELTTVEEPSGEPMVEDTTSETKEEKVAVKTTASEEKEIEAAILQEEIQKQEIEEGNPAEENSSQEETSTQKLSKEEILAKLKAISGNAEDAERQEVDSLKQAFYKILKGEQEAARKAFIDNGGEGEAFQPTTDETETEFKSLLNLIREKRSNKIAEQEKIKEDNLQAKLDIIEKLKELVSRPDEANKAYNDFNKLQQQWNEIKLVPAGKVNELWKSYQLYVEKFYDILKLNNEFRDYDFKKNLEIKTRLCVAAEKLADEQDVISAFHQLQKLHQEFRDTGPVAKDLREQVWTRFKAASTAVNRRHQQHFESLKENEQRNLDEKTVICEIVEAIDYNELKTFSDWENKTKEIIALQAKWKTIGFAPQKMNVKIFERFRGACDEFFSKKAEFYKAIKEDMNQNLEKKKALCEKAESLKESTDWKETADILTKIQKEWKTIGPVPKKHSDAIWKRFIGACDYFFEQKNKANSSQRTVELENLEKKKVLIEKLESFDESLEASEAESQIKAIMQEWSEIGFVPFKEKDRIYKQYHALLDKQFERLHLSAAARRLSSFRSNITNAANQSDRNASQTLYRERERLVRAYDNMKNDIQTYENNLGFLTSSSKKGNSFVNEITRKVEKLKSDLELILKKIEVIDETLKQQDKE